jgi:hypothetical protein
MGRKGEEREEGATTAKLDVAPEPKALPPAATIEAVPYRRLFW